MTNPFEFVNAVRFVGAVGGLKDEEETIGDEKIPTPAAFCAATLKSYDMPGDKNDIVAVVADEFVSYVYHSPGGDDPTDDVL